MAVGQPLVVDSEAVQDTGLQIVRVNRIGHDVASVVVRLPEHHAELGAAAGQPWQ